MSKRSYIPTEKLQIIYAMYKLGYPYRAIAGIVNLDHQLVRKRIVKAGITKTPPITKPPKKVGKYDHLFEEPVCQGRMYQDYLL